MPRIRSASPIPDRPPAERPAATIRIDAHRNHRGPYTATGALIRGLIAHYAVAAEVAAAPRIVTLLEVVPELRASLTISPAIDRSFAYSREGNRQNWGLRIAHGVADFMLDCLRRAAAGPLTIVCDDIAHADPRDRLCIAVLQDRATRSGLALQVIANARARHGRVPGGPIGKMTPAARRKLARRFIDSDCTARDPPARAAYAALPRLQRRALHAARATTLERRGEPSLAMGAIPFHHEQAGADATALVAAAKACMDIACYEAALDWGGRALRRPDPDGTLHDIARRHMLFALLLLDRHDEVDAHSTAWLATGAGPALLATIGYAQAILAARLRPPDRQDHDAARQWIERALAASAALPPSPARIANIAFLHNTLALVAWRGGQPERALSLLDDAIADIARQAPESFAIESTILFHNRARLQRAGGDTAGAIAAFETLLTLEPSNAEALFDRGVIQQQAGRHDAAVADFDAALFWAPPQIETLFNRARALAALERAAEALADYDHLLAIDPDHLPARSDRARLHYGRGAHDAAAADIAAGLTRDPGNAELLCLRGLIALAARKLTGAAADFDAAIARDPTLADAWANRATIAWKRGDTAAALADLDVALGLRDDPAMRRNRARMIGMLQLRNETDAPRIRDEETATPSPA